MSDTPTKECFVQDSDDHWYLITVEQKPLFFELLDKADYESIEDFFGTQRLLYPVSDYCFENCERIGGE